VPVDGFGPGDVDDIAARVRQRLGPEVQVIIDPVKEIPRTAAGKFRAVVSLLPKNRRVGEGA
jgi:phenylacetate-CoA ligase